MAIRRCWCALWAPLAVDYTRHMEIEPEVDGMGVLLQKLVPADSAGVLFTADPRTGNPWSFVLESSFGLARDWIASTGSVPVDRYILEWDTREILTRQIATKYTALTAGKNGLETIDISQDRQTSPSLSDNVARRVAEIGLQIDRALGTRVDIEWVVAGDDVHIVQVRPLTALPEFFPHHLPTNLASQTWHSTQSWHFKLRKNNGTQTLPIYRDKLISESYNRYLQVGSAQIPFHRRSGAERDFQGHRYAIQGKSPWPGLPPSQLEPYLIEHEHEMRADYLNTIDVRWPEIGERARCLEVEASTLEQAVDAILWAQDEIWDIGSVIAGPTQQMAHNCRELLEDFVEQNLPGVDVSDLSLGHHAALKSYWPHVLVAEADAIAKRLGPVDRRIGDLSLKEFTVSLERGEVASGFLSALEIWFDRLGLTPPWKFHVEEDDVYGKGQKSHSIQILRILRNALKGGLPIERIQREATLWREDVVTEVRGKLAGRPDELARFERLYDWNLFWGPELNERVLRGDVPSRKLHRLFRRMRNILLKTALVDDVNDVIYFTTDDLSIVAAPGDISLGRQLLQKRKHEHERNDRLVAPAYLGKHPEGAASEASPAMKPNKPETASIITGKPQGAGQRQGIIKRVESMGEGDDVAGKEDVVVLIQPEQSHNNHVPLLFSMLLRIRGLIVPDTNEMWTAHIGQTARECRVPVVRVALSDLERLVDGRRVEIDGSRGVVTLLDD